MVCLELFLLYLSIEQILCERLLEGCICKVFLVERFLVGVVLEEVEE